MKSCKECLFYQNGVCGAFPREVKPETEPCDKFRLNLNNKEDGQEKTKK